MSDNKPTSLNEILDREYHCGHCGWDMQLSDATVNEIRAAITALIPGKRYSQMLVEEQVDHIDSVVNSFLLSEGYNDAIDTIKRNFTGQTDNERKQP